ncbi:hypothetical protein IE53DRAFT_245246 [Violaceomyces palustris]|uniref:Uncharacterized protein n=1 Tax=Violaceomyces palustris TaxID=1673888 RepID=A0ACD0NNX0_9BASI|nr:hypothetical protein IE53DRAFT_245246 [Violaceomyces palustris]
MNVGWAWMDGWVRVFAFSSFTSSLSTPPFPFPIPILDLLAIRPPYLACRSSQPQPLALPTAPPCLAYLSTWRKVPVPPPPPPPQGIPLSPTLGRSVATTPPSNTFLRIPIAKSD